MTGISVTVDDAEVVAALRRLQDRTGNLTPAMRAIGGVLQSNVDLGFRGQHDPWGNAWRPLSATTIANRRRGRSGGTSVIQILRDTGILANSINTRVASNSVSVGTAVSYAEKHQFGKGVPRRAFLPITAAGEASLPTAWRDEVLDVLGRYLMEARP